MLRNRHIQLEKWIPDNTFWNQKSLYRAENVIGQLNGYAPLPSLQGDGSQVEANARVRGAMTFRSDTSNLHTLCGTATEIYQRTSGGTWNGIGDVTFTTDAGSGFWDFTQFGSLAIMVNGADAPRKWDFITAPVNTSALGGSPPIARYVCTFFDFTVLGNLDGEPSSVHWSGINDPEEWTPGTNSSDKQEFPDAGQITGLFGDQNLIVFQERSIRIGTFAPGSPEIIQFEVLSNEIGCVAYRGSAKIGNVIFFISDGDFYSLEGLSLRPIGTEEVMRWFRTNIRPELRSRTICGIDPIRKTVYWTFFSTMTATDNVDEVVADYTLIYHWPSKKWTYGVFGFESPFPLSSPALGLEDLDTFGTLDSLTLSLDSSAYNTESMGSSFVVFTSNSEMGDLSGANSEAKLTLVNQHYYSPERQLIEGVYPITDAQNVSVALNARSRIDSGPVFSNYADVESSGWCPHHSSSRMHDIDIKITSDQEWTFINGLYVKSEPDGEL